MKMRNLVGVLVLVQFLAAFDLIDVVEGTNQQPATPSHQPNITTSKLNHRFVEQPDDNPLVKLIKRFPGRRILLSSDEDYDSDDKDLIDEDDDDNSGRRHGRIRDFVSGIFGGRDRNRRRRRRDPVSQVERRLKRHLARWQRRIDRSVEKAERDRDRRKLRELRAKVNNWLDELEQWSSSLGPDSGPDGSNGEHDDDLKPDKRPDLIRPVEKPGIDLTDDSVPKPTNLVSRPDKPARPSGSGSGGSLAYPIGSSTTTDQDDEDLPIDVRKPATG